MQYNNISEEQKTPEVLNRKRQAGDGERKMRKRIENEIKRLQAAQENNTEFGAIDAELDKENVIFLLKQIKNNPEDAENILSAYAEQAEIEDLEYVKNFLA